MEEGNIKKYENVIDIACDPILKKCSIYVGEEEWKEEVVDCSSLSLGGPVLCINTLFAESPVFDVAYPKGRLAECKYNKDTKDLFCW